MTFCCFHLAIYYVLPFHFRHRLPIPRGPHSAKTDIQPGGPHPIRPLTNPGRPPRKLPIELGRKHKLQDGLLPEPGPSQQSGRSHQLPRQNAYALRDHFAADDGVHGSELWKVDLHHMSQHQRTPLLARPGYHINVFSPIRVGDKGARSKTVEGKATQEEGKPFQKGVRPVKEQRLKKQLDVSSVFRVRKILFD